MKIDVNAWVDQQGMDEERDNRRFGNDEFDFLDNSILKVEDTYVPED